MRKEYYNYVVKLPVLLHDLFREKVADYHFTDMTVVMNHLVKSYIRVTCGGKVSTATRRILLHMDRIPDMGFFFRRQEKAVLFFEMDPAVTDSLQHAIASGGWGNRQRLAVCPVCAFCCGADVTLNNLSMELAAEEVFRRPEGYLVHTYVSNYQYVFLKETASAQRMSVEGILTAAAELLVGSDDGGTDYHIPDVERFPPPASGEYPHEHHRSGPYLRLHGKARYRFRPGISSPRGPLLPGGAVPDLPQGNRARGG